MQNQYDPRTTGVNTATVGVPRAARDAGLRSYMSWPLKSSQPRSGAFTP